MTEAAIKLDGRDAVRTGDPAAPIDSGDAASGLSKHDPITVVGAGPSGLACAIALARRGRRVIVRELRHTVGARFHGDFQGLENWSSEHDVIDELSQQGIQPTFDHHPISAGIAFDARGGRYEVRSERPLFYLVRRGSDAGTLDTGLLTQAFSLGVEVRFNDRVETIHGPAVLAGGPRVADAIAVGYVFATGVPDGGWVCFDDRLAPLGYAYLLIHKGRGTVASCMFTGFKQEAEYVARTVAMFEQRVGLVMNDPLPFGGYANFRLPKAAVQGGHLVVGEHAGFQDALAGFGMRYAIQSGLLSARSLIENLDYRSLWRRELLPLLRASTVNRFLFDIAGEEGRRWMLAHRLSTRDTGRELHRLYAPAWWKDALLPIASWRYRSRLRDKSCDHRNCACIWCRCGGAGLAVVHAPV